MHLCRLEIWNVKCVILGTTSFCFWIQRCLSYCQYWIVNGSFTLQVTHRMSFRNCLLIYVTFRSPSPKILMLFPDTQTHIRLGIVIDANKIQVRTHTTHHNTTQSECHSSLSEIPSICRCHEPHSFSLIHQYFKPSFLFYFHLLNLSSSNQIECT